MIDVCERILTPGIGLQKPSHLDPFAVFESRRNQKHVCDGCMWLFFLKLSCMLGMSS